MTDLRISQLPPITGANMADTDQFVIARASTTQNFSVTRAELFSSVSAISLTGDLTVADRIVHSGDTNTAIRFPAADTVTVETNGAERLRITAAGNVGIGTSNPTLPLTVGDSTLPAGVAVSGQMITGTTNGTSLLTLRYSEAAGNPIISQLTSAGTPSTPTVVANGRALGRNNWNGFDGTNYINAAAIAVQVDGVPSTGSVPGRMLFFTTPSGSGTALERVRITSAGNVGIATSAPVVPLHVTGATMTTGVVYRNQPAQTSKAAAATLTIAELLTGIIQYTGAADNLTLPTGTSIEGGLPATFPTNMSFDVSVINTGSGTATIVTNTGLTTVGGLTVTAGASGVFRFRKTATNTYSVYRIS